MTELHNQSILLLYGATGTNPNGDPMMGNAPRSEAASGRLFVTDGRIKRFIRDALEVAQDKNLYVTNQGGTKKAEERLVELDVKASANPKEKDLEAARQTLLANTFDTKFFGAVLTKPTTNIKGSLQIASQNYALHEVMPQVTQISSVFSGRTSGSGNLGTTTFVPFVDIAVNARFNAKQGEQNNVTAQDLEELYKILPSCMDHAADSRSKMGHRMTAVVGVQWVKNGPWATVDLAKLVSATVEAPDRTMPFDASEVTLNTQALTKFLEDHKEHIDVVRLYEDAQTPRTSLEDALTAAGIKTTRIDGTW